MKKLIMLLAVASLMLSTLLTAVPVHAQPTIDGTLVSGEWDAYYLGTSETTWAGGMSVDVYGFADDGFLYVAYKVDIPSSPGFATALILGIPPNFYYKTPQTAAWPDPGYTIFEMTYPWVMQTDGTDWVVVYPDLASMVAAGIEIGLNTNWWNHNGEAELKIPLSLLTYAGTDGVIRISGQYWQYDWATPFYVTLPATYLLEDLKAEINALSAADLKKPAGDRKVALCDKIDDVIAKIIAGDYTGAVMKLEQDIKPKLDGISPPSWLTTAHPELVDKINSVIDYLT